jgi:hypothetical protein
MYTRLGGRLDDYQVSRLTGEPARHPLPNPHRHLHRLDIGLGEPRLAELHGYLVSLLRLEYAVDHATGETDRLVER